MAAILIATPPRYVHRSYHSEEAENMQFRSISYALHRRAVVPPEYKSRNDYACPLATAWLQWRRRCHDALQAIVGGVWLDRFSSFDLIASKRGHWDHKLTHRPRVSTTSWSSWIHCLPLAALQVALSPSRNVTTRSLEEAIGSQSLVLTYLHSPSCLVTNFPKQSRTPNLNDGVFLLL